MEKILITGATGFIGSFIAEEAVKRGMETWVAVRKSSSLKYLDTTKVHTIELDLGNEEQLHSKIDGMDFDYVVHAAGLTKSLKREAFFKVNTEGTRNLARVVASQQKKVKKFVFLSSLSIYGPIHEEQPYKDICLADTPKPNTAYGESKLLAEKALAEIEGLDYVILRPTGVYGPREKDYMMMVDSIRNHVDFAVGYKPQDITFIYVRDLVQAVYLAIEKGERGDAFFLSDGQVYSSRTFSDLIQKYLGNPWVLHIKAPIWVLRVVTFCGERISRITGKISALNDDKYNIMRQRNWRCDITPAIEKLGYKPEYDLERGVKEMLG